MSLLSLVLPTIGQPDSTEDPKVNNAFTAITNWANGNIDQSNISSAKGLSPLHFVTTTVNYTAANGDLVQANAAVVVTLPAPARDTLIAIWASTNGVILSASSGGLYGPGVGGQTSVPVHINSVLIVQADGTNWAIISGLVDSGWQPFPFYANGWGPVSGPYGSNQPGWRKEGNLVRLAGNVSGGASGNAITVMPAGARPLADSFYVCETSYTTFGVVVANAGGNITPNFASGTAIALDPVIYYSD